MNASPPADLSDWTRQDADFHALAIDIDFRGEREGGDYWAFSSEGTGPEWGDMDDDPTVASNLLRLVTTQVLAALAPWVSHYGAMGLIRSDGVEGGVRFYLVYETSREAASAAALGVFPETRLSIDAVPGATLTIHCNAEPNPTNATLLYEELRQEGAAQCRWGGEPTPRLLPQPGESRDAWLKRVALSARAVSRLVERWERSGGNLELFGHFGSAAERAAGDQPIEWVVPGLLPRGYVSLLVGTKQAGKSTLAGEIAAVFDSECQSARWVLGTEVSARGVSGIVSGEDGDNFINRRAEFYEPVHGEPLGLVVDTSVRPWEETLALLQSAPRLDFLVIDPLRAILGGDEDSSGNNSRLFDELNALARTKNCAILLVHHLSKTTPRSLSAMLLAVRGSGVITDRPRVVIGMIDRGHGVTEVGIIKHNVPPSEALWGETNVGRLFRRDKASLTLVPIEGAIRSADADDDVERLAAVAAAIQHHNERGEILRRTGKSELFERKVPQLAGLSRQATRELVGALLEAGKLTDGQDGLQLANVAVASSVAAGLATPATAKTFS